MPSQSVVFLVREPFLTLDQAGVSTLHIDLECQRVRAHIEIDLDPFEQTICFNKPLYSRRVFEL